MDNKKVSIKPKVKTKLKVKKKIAVGNVKANNKKIKLKQKQKQNQKQVNTQKVTINLSDLKPKRTYTRRKPAVPKQAMVTPTQPQTFQPNNQVLVNDLTQKLKEHEKILQKKIDNELKQNEIKEQKKINKMVHESIPDLKDSDIDAMMQHHQNMLKANEKYSGINKDADNFFKTNPSGGGEGFREPNVFTPTNNRYGAFIDDLNAEEPPRPKRGRGRPKGAKNKKGTGKFKNQ